MRQNLSETKPKSQDCIVKDYAMAYSSTYDLSHDVSQLQVSHFERFAVA